MRRESRFLEALRRMVAAVAFGTAAPACGHAGDRPLVGPEPAWVVASPAGKETAAAAGLPVAALLNDSQLSFDAGGWTQHLTVQVKVQASAGLQALSAIPFAWSPWSDTLTFHELAILRGGQRIDILPKAADITVIRREAALEQATLTGELTAVLQPDGLQVGDVLELKLSTRHADPLLKGRAAALIAAFDVAPLGRLRVTAQWPTSLPVRWRETPGLPAFKRTQAEGLVRAELQLDDIAPSIAPAHAPIRYLAGRQIELTTFRDWSEVAAVMAPLYVRAAELAPQSPLRSEVTRIAGSSSDPAVRAGAALQLVQSQVRYLARVEAAGNYQPQSADETWRVRYGDCKAKTALLLGLLKALGVAAEPVLVNVGFGDAVAEHLPSASVFNHVLVHVRLNGRDFWLDGARQGDGRLDQLPTPDYQWGLPLVDGANLVRVLPAPAAEPMLRQTIRYDASNGVTAPVLTHLETDLTGDAGFGAHQALDALASVQKTEALRAFWASNHTAFTPKTMTAEWDAEHRVERLVADGTSKLDWSGSGLELQHVELGGAPDLKRAAGTHDPDAPFATDYPSFVETDESVVLPTPVQIPAAQLKSLEVNQVLGGVAYRRTASQAGRVFRVVASQRAMVAEVSAKEARASVEPLTQLGETGVYAPAGGQSRAANDAAAMDSQATTAEQHMRRGDALADANRQKEAEAEYTAAIELDPKLIAAWSGRASARALQTDPRAVADADEADRLGPPGVVAARARAIYAAQSGHRDEAAADYDRILTRWPNDRFALAQRTQIEVSKGDYAAAERDLATLGKVYPDTEPAATLQRAGFEAVQNRKAAAFELAAHAAVRSSDDHLMRARLYYGLGATPQALADIDAALSAKPSAAAYLLRSQIRGAGSAQGRADMAAAEALEPNSVEGQEQRIWALRAAYDDAGALAAVSKLLDAHPDLFEMRVQRAELEAFLGKQSDAEADIRKARAALGTNPAALVTLCLGEANAHTDPASTLTDCSEAMRAFPKAKALAAVRAIAAHRLGLDAQAAADVAAARRAAEGDAIELNNVCYNVASDGFELAAALSACDAAVHLQSSAANIIDSRGFVLLRLGRNEEAIAAYTAALKLNPKLAVSLYGRAVAEARLGQAAVSAKDKAAALALQANLSRRFAFMQVEDPTR